MEPEKRLKMTLYIICMYCMICIRICIYIYILYMFIGNDISNYEVQCIFEHVSVLCFDNNSVVQ